MYFFIKQINNQFFFKKPKKKEAVCFFHYFCNGLKIEKRITDRNITY
jgi:hypothetical protein